MMVFGALRWESARGAGRGIAPQVAAAALASVLFGSGCDVEDLATPTVPGPAEEVPLHPVEVNEPESLSALTTEIQDPRGGSVGVRCMTCHSLRDRHQVPDDAAGLGEVHAGLVFDHGELSCRSCHDPERADGLRLADGTTLEMVEAMRLCAQCHGPQARDFQHGSHGGMRGYWDRRRGPVQRNHCIDCHDPHQPQVPTYRPTPPMRDRFLEPEGGHDG